MINRDISVLLSVSVAVVILMFFIFQMKNTDVNQSLRRQRRMEHFQNYNFNVASGLIDGVRRKVRAAHSLFHKMMKRGYRAPIDFDNVPGI